MNNRIIAILNQHENANASIKSLVDACRGAYDKMIVFTSEQQFQADEDVQIELFPPDVADNVSKMKNFAIRKIKSSGYAGMLHVVEDRVSVLKPIDSFIPHIEAMMKKLELNSWFGTVTDSCNYVYQKYCPRLNIRTDSAMCDGIGTTNLLTCSHSNVHWIIVNLAKADDNELYFSESFLVDMFWIIEFLARRRATHNKSLYFMNQYFTCIEEKGAYELNKLLTPKVQFDFQQQMKTENQTFAAMNVNNKADNNIDLVLETLYLKLKNN